jgi:hypothetical protein
VAVLGERLCLGVAAVTGAAALILALRELNQGTGEHQTRKAAISACSDIFRIAAGARK